MEWKRERVSERSGKGKEEMKRSGRVIERNGEEKKDGTEWKRE